MGGRLSRQSSLEESEPQQQQQPPSSEGEQRGHFNLTSLIISPDRLPEVLRRSSPAPYVQRVAWIREIQALLRDQKPEKAYAILRQLRKLKEILPGYCYIEL